jgi:cytochrome P450
MSVVFDPFSPTWRDDPYPKYRELRDQAPVYRVPDQDIWCVSRYDDVAHVLKHPEQFSSRAMFTMLMNAGSEGPPPLSLDSIHFVAKMAWKTRLNPLKFATSRNLIAEDGQRHTDMRALVNRGFSPRRVTAWQERAQALVDDCLAGLRAGEDFDVVADLAIPLPVTIIAEMLGVEPERLADFKRWSDAVVESTSGAGRAQPFSAPFREALIELINYLKGIAQARRARPADDLVSLLVASQSGEEGLTDREVIQFGTLLLVAGNETTTNLIGNAVTALLDHPDQLAKVAADPALVPALIEETLRYDAPVQLVMRTVTEALELGGQRLTPGEIVVAMLGSANRDERRFPDPDRFDVERHPQGHLGFGFGKHFCLGASLARLEAEAALQALVPELPRLRRSEEKLERIDSFLVRGPTRIPLQA